MVRTLVALLAPPHALAGKLEARLQLESQSLENFRSLDNFLSGLFEALKQMDAEVQSVKTDNARLAEDVKEVCVCVREFGGARQLLRAHWIGPLA